MADATVRVEAEGVTQLGKQFLTVEKNIGRMGRTGSRVTARIGAGLRRAASAAGSLAAQLGVGLGLAAVTKAVFDFDKALQQVQTDGNLTLKQIVAFKKQILSLAGATGQSKESVTAILDVFQAMGGITGKLNEKVNETTTLFQFLARTAKATGSDSKELASIVTNLITQMGLSPKGAADTIAALVKQANEGQIPLKNMARVLPEMFGATTGLEQKGKKAALLMNQLLQTVGPAVGNNADKAKESILAMIRDIRAATNKKGKIGAIQVLNKKGQIKDINETLRALLVKTKGNAKKLSKIFKDASQKGLNAFIKQFDPTTGQFKKKIQGGGATIGSLTRVGKGGVAGDIDKALANRRATGIAKEADAFDRAMRKVEATLQTVGKSAIKFVAKNPKTALAGAIAGAGALKLGAAALGGKLGAVLGAGGGLAGGLAAKQAGITPVYVTNFPAGGGAAGALTAAGGKAAAGGGFAATLGGAAVAGAATAGGVVVAAIAAGNLLGKLAAKTHIALFGGKDAGIGPLLAPQKVKDAITKFDSEERQKKQAARISGGGLLQTAQSLGAAGRAGAKTFGPEGKSLDQATILKELAAKAAASGNQAAFLQQLPLIVTALTGIAKNPAKVIIKAPGLDNPTVQKGRGAGV